MESAKKLMLKFKTIKPLGLTTKEAKQCALICLDEMIESLEYGLDLTTEIDSEERDVELSYRLRLREYIEKNY